MSVFYIKSMTSGLYGLINNPSDRIINVQNIKYIFLKVKLKIKFQKAGGF